MSEELEASCRGGTVGECDVDMPPEHCLFRDGVTGIRETGAGTLYGVGGYFTGTDQANLALIVNGGKPIGLGKISVGTEHFFGVIGITGFTSFRVEETDGKVGQERYVFADDFTFGYSGMFSIFSDGFESGGHVGMVSYHSLISRPHLLVAGVLVAAVFMPAAAHGQMVAEDDTFAVPYAETLLVEAPGVLDNDTFNGGTAEDAGAVIDLVISGVTHGILILNSDGSFSYDPFPDFPGVDSFTYQASVGAETSQATVTLSACDTGPTVFTCWMEGPYLAKLGELGYGTFQEGFESDAAWGSVREPSTALSVVSQGIAWQSNHPDPPASNEITTGDGAARTGLWGVYDPDHGYATGTPEGCNVPTPECLFKDGFTGIRQSGASTLYGAGGFFSGTHGANLALILDGGAPIGLGKITVGIEQFFGVIDTAGFATFRFEETDGKVGQSRLVFADDFTFGTSPADTTPPQVSLVNSVSDTGDGILAEGESTAAAITQLLVTFDEVVSDEGGETAPHSVTNPSNYLLFSDGGDGFDTVNCAAGIDASDTAVAVDWVTYVSGSERTATLDINGGAALASGNYRLLVCGSTSIKDWAGNSLDGDANGTGGDDFARNFTVTGPPGYLQFSLAAYSAAENGTSATITVTRTGGDFGAVSVDYATADGSATATEDYTAASGTINFLDGDAVAKTFNVPITDDSTWEGDETVNLSLTSPVGATLGAQSTAILTITEDDAEPPAGTLQFEMAAYSVAENGTSATITVTRTGGDFGAVSVDYATADGSATATEDYTAASGTINFLDGDAVAKTFNVPITDDSTWEGDETVNLSLTSPVGATLGAQSTAILTITEDDAEPPAGTLQFEMAAYSVAENGTSATITVTRTGGDFGAVSVDYATADGSATATEDYTAASGTINFLDGDAVAKTFNVPITDDSTWEGDETVNLSLTSPVGATLGAQSTAILTITEDDAEPPAGTLQFEMAAYSVAENGTSATITVTRTGGDFGAVSVDYATADGSATATEDYTAVSGTINFLDGDAVAKTFNVPITDDSTWEGDETVNLSLNTPVGATLGTQISAVLTITEDDPGTWFVGPTGSDAADCISSLTPCLTIGEAVFRAASGDSIQVASGLYPETLALSKSLAVIGNGVNPVIDGSGSGVVVGVLAGATVTMSNFEIRNGTIGGVENAGNLTLIESWIHSNGDGSAATFGGVSTSGVGRIERCTVSGNLGDTSGGVANFGQLDVVNSTVQGNAAAFAPGFYNPSGSTLDLQYSTVAENGAYGIRGGGTVRAEASIIALHATANCESAIDTLGYNLEDGFSCGMSAPAGDVIGVDPLLGPLAAVGGSTPTMALEAGSPAIDAGGNVGYPATDQRGLGRPVDGDEDGTPTCDIGAFELQSLPLFTDDFESGNTSAWTSTVP